MQTKTVESTIKKNSRAPGKNEWVTWFRLEYLNKR